VRAIAEALGGHCRTLRRLEVGPFSVEDADEERVIPPTRRWRCCREPPERAIAIGTFDGVHLGTGR
jgi:hypothetical protein